jgi:N-acyl homoserine lactone hydrolase
VSLNVDALGCGGWPEGNPGHLPEDGEGHVRLPIPAYLVEHPKDRAVFDAGMHLDCRHDAVGRVGARRAGRLAVDDHPGEEIGARRAARKKTGIRLFGGHDPDFWQTLPQVPAAIG